MPFTEFCCRSGGSNLNAGTLTGNSTEPGTSASFTYASGNWVASTGVFTVASGNPQSDGVAVGDFASVYADGSTVTGFVGRVTARTTTTITVSLSAKAGTAPTDGTGNRTLRIGGAWQGPNGTSGFPFGVVAGTLTNTSGHAPRVNFKNDVTYSVTSAISHTQVGPVQFQGYTSAYGDFGRANIDGGTSGSSYVLLTLSGSGVAYTHVVDLIFSNNGATGSANLVNAGSDNRAGFARCVFRDSRGNGLFAVVNAVECEAYACNKSNTSNTAGIYPSGGGVLVRCVSHDNTGSNASGFYSQGGSERFVMCIADSNGQSGFRINNVSGACLYACDAYNNTGDGLTQLTLPGVMFIDSCNFVKNGGWGINVSGASMLGVIQNCGFGAGTQANTSGQMNTHGMETINNVTYANDVTPWVDPANGDFRITLAAAKGAGRGTYTQTAASYSGTVGYPDIGAAQHQDSGSGGLNSVRHMTGGFSA